MANALGAGILAADTREDIARKWAEHVAASRVRFDAAMAQALAQEQYVASGQEQRDLDAAGNRRAQEAYARLYAPVAHVQADLPPGLQMTFGDRQVPPNFPLVKGDQVPPTPQPGKAVMGSTDVAIQKFYEGGNGFGPTESAFSLGGIVKGVVNIGKTALGLAGSGGGGTTTNVFAGAEPSCLAFLTRGDMTGYMKCSASVVKESITGSPLKAIQQFTGAGPVFQTFASSPAQQGMFGALATKPQQRNTAKLVCPRGLVLGQDDMCYARGTIPRKFRKWKPDRKPPVSAGDAGAIRRAARAKRRVRRLATEVGLSTHSRGAHRAGPPKRKR